MEKLGIKCKQLMAEEMQERLKQTNNLFITSFNSTSVPEQESLRCKLKQAGASFFMVKNRIAKQVFQRLELDVVTPLVQGPTAVALGGHDSICISKALVDFAGKHENFTILGGYVDKRVIYLASIKQLASISSREALLAQVFAGFKSPIQGLVNTLSATLKKFVVVIDKISKARTYGTK